MPTHNVQVNFASIRDAQNATAALAFKVLSAEDDTMLSNPKLVGRVFSIDVQAESETAAQDIVKEKFFSIQETEDIVFAVGMEVFTVGHEPFTVVPSLPSLGTRKRFLGLF